MKSTASGVFNKAKVLFTSRFRRQNFRPSLLCLVDRLYTVIHKMQKTRAKVLPSATTGEEYFRTKIEVFLSLPWWLSQFS